MKINRDVILKFRVTQEEKEQIRCNALSSYRLPSEYLREVALQTPIINKEGFREFASQLQRLGNNLNQLVVLVREEKVQAANLESVRKELNEIWQLLSLRL